MTERTIECQKCGLLVKCITDLFDPVNTPSGELKPDRRARVVHGNEQRSIYCHCGEVLYREIPDASGEWKEVLPNMTSGKKIEVDGNRVRLVDTAAE